MKSVLDISFLNIFILTCSWTFHFFDNAFFDEKFLILVKSSAQIFALVGTAFCDFLRNLCLPTKWRYLCMFLNFPLQINLYVLCEVGVKFRFFPMPIFSFPQFFSNIYWHVICLPFHIGLLWHFCQKSIDHGSICHPVTTVDLFLGSLSCSIILFILIAIYIYIYILSL